MKTIFAYTDNSEVQPGFVSLSLKDKGGLALTAREAITGKQLFIMDFPDDQVQSLMTSLGMYMTSNALGRTEKQRLELIDQEILSRIQAGESVQYEMAVLTSALKQDPAYLWSWYCNLVMSFVDMGCAKKLAMAGAALFLHTLTQVDVTQLENYQKELKALG